MQQLNLQQQPEQSVLQVLQRQQQQLQQNSQAVGQQRAANKRRRNDSGFFHGRRAEQQGGRNNNAAARVAEANAADAAADSNELYGYSHCPVRNMHFRILPDSSGVVGFRESDVTAVLRVNKENEERKRQEKEREERYRRMPATRTTTLSLLSSLSLGRMAGPSLQRMSHETRMQQIEDTPSQTIDVSDFLPFCRYSGLHSVVGCEFIDVSADGETLTGCWAVAGASGHRAASVACSFKASVNEEGGRGGNERRRGDRWLDMSRTRGPSISVHANEIVDMTMAPADREVTCLLYATATSTHHNGRVNSYCEVSTRPILCRFDGEEDDVSDSPIYNVYQRMRTNIYSCAWSPRSMKIGVGMEYNVDLYDVMSEQRTTVGTRNKSAIAQEFDKSGSTLFLGLRYDAACVKDLRTRDLSVTIPNSKNTCWLRLLEKVGQQVVLQTIDGKISLFDIRRPIVALRSYEGHVTKGTSRTPTFVDNDEQFVCAAGTDNVTRVWSLSSGRLLRSITAGATTPTELTRNYPRPVYSPNWGSRPGQGALLVAAGTHINVYRMEHE
ncbi:hypothetical protein PFISCL1PPCAC_8829 [Pristionchus fissidentatus]|uniref:WD40 domain-containing protein n=1 Tax=Pristionchus fissidentatus TaxID=1538716 RepID=A0AAV5VHD9_9BILA|nr:hypothetical protein PFISCL1PPCAC_8829 [Pristionchus fissidentatus]